MSMVYNILLEDIRTNLATYIICTIYHTGKVFVDQFVLSGIVCVMVNPFCHLIA
jgi:hypothetical protein